MTVVNANEHLKELEQLFTNKLEKAVANIELLPQAGSDRLYFRITSTNNEQYIGTYNANKNENNSFFYFSRIFEKYHLPVPEIIATNRDKRYYIQSDLGNTSLLDVLQAEGFTDRVKMLYKKAIEQLTKFHWQASKEIDYSLCFSSTSFDRNAILSDLLYFKYYFADILKLDYDKNIFMEEIELWAKSFAAQKPQTFMYRDFQSRNILVKNEEVFFIDYQGGMLGLPMYDLASLLWQAKAQLPEEWKNELLNYYFTCIQELPERPNFDETAFRRIYVDCVLLRILQTLGAYGYKGLIERRAHFLSSIYPALNQLQTYLKNWPHLPTSNELRKVLTALGKPEIINQFEHYDVPQNNGILQVKLYSFSYKKGIPVDETPNGGGFVFDCRGILNPGRFEEYKTQTGMDKPVQDFLLEKTTFPTFIQAAKNIVDISVTDYLKRDFTSLQISFGCTGGQHRSVFAAEQMKQHLKSKYNIDAQLIHLEQQENNIARR